MSLVPSLVFFLLLPYCGAIRPQDTSHQDGTGATAHRASPIAVQGNEALAVGHSASLQRDGGRKRLPRTESAALSQLSYESPGPSAAQNSTQEQNASPAGQPAPGPAPAVVPDANAGGAGPAPGPALDSAPGVAEKMDAPSPSAAQLQGEKDVGSSHSKPLSPTLDDAALPAVALPEKGPIADLFGEVQDGDEKDGAEATQELDDVINDVEEVERVLYKVGHKLGKFYNDEGYRHVILNLVLYLCGVFLAMGLYFMWFQHREVVKQEEFRYGLCECMGDSRVCLCGLCCPIIRWADTVSEEKGGFLDFNSAFIMMLALGAFLLCPLTGLVGWIAIVMLGVYYRQKIRDKYGLENNTTASYIEDFMTWCCCSCCALCQEARQVDEYTKLADDDLPDDGTEHDGTETQGSVTGLPTEHY